MQIKLSGNLLTFVNHFLLCIKQSEYEFSCISRIENKQNPTDKIGLDDKFDIESDSLIYCELVMLINYLTNEPVINPYTLWTLIIKFTLYALWTHLDTKPHTYTLGHQTPHTYLDTPAHTRDKFL